MVDALVSKRKLIVFGWVCLLCIVLFSGTAKACRLYGVISESLPDGLLEKHLVTDPNSLKELCRLGNKDGWGIGYIPIKGEKASIVRGAIRASADPGYDKLVQSLEVSKPQILIAHIRWCSSGCCAHGKDAIEDPHPFYRDQDGKRWIFVHNGGVSIERMQKLIGEEYLRANPPNGSAIAACSDKVVDSELYFLYLLKNIEEHNGDAVKGIMAAVSSMVKNGEKGSMNFILSDGQNMWAFRRNTQGVLSRIISLYMPFTLYYLHDPSKGYSVVASRYPTKEQGNWIAMQDYDLVVFNGNQPPQKITINPFKE